MATKVLVVEDDAFLLKAYTMKLQGSGFDVRTSTNGEEALAALQEFNPDVVLLDLVMPRMDGFVTLERIRQQDAYKNLPVFVISNLGQKNERQRVMELGATEFLIKSNLSMKELVDKINGAAQPQG